MLKKLVPISAAVAAIMIFAGNAAAITVTPYTTEEALVNNILGSGITVSNITKLGGNSSFGFFDNADTVPLGINSGIVLSSGYANYAGNNTNTNDGITGYTGGGSDADLAALIPGYAIYDKALLEFDFESAGGDLYFNYVFASDEYNEYTNSPYNDVFGFFLDGNNIALVPGTSTPVSINNVNGGKPLGFNALNSQYYNNNDPSDGGNYPFEYDGFTDVLTAQALGLSVGTHHIKLAIADSGDNLLDSAVFIQSGSFSDKPKDDPGGNNVVPEPATMLLLGPGLLGLMRLQKRHSGIGGNKMKKTLLIVLIALLAITVRAEASMLDLTTVNSNGFIGDAFFKWIPSQSTGSGVINPFVRVSTNDGIEQGYNTSGRPLPYDENNSPVFTRDLLLSDVPIVNIGGTDYREFLLDINQNGCPPNKECTDPLLSLDQIKIYQSDTTGKNTANLSDLGYLAYSLDPVGADNWIKLNYSLNSGSGSGDMLAYIPTSYFGDYDYLYFYSQFGSNFENNDGYEEWAVRTADNPPPVIPEPTSMMLLGTGLVGLVSLRRKKTV